MPDCLKLAVARANKYEPDINPVDADFATRYGIVIVPARAYYPRISSPGKGRKPKKER